MSELYLDLKRTIPVVPAWAVICAWAATFAILTLGSRGRLPLTCKYCGKGVKIGASHCHHCGR